MKLDLHNWIFSAPLIILARLAAIIAVITIGIMANAPFSDLFTRFNWLGWDFWIQEFLYFVGLMVFPSFVVILAGWCLYQFQTTTEVLRPLEILFSVVFIGSALTQDYLFVTVIVYCLFRRVYLKIPWLGDIRESERNIF